ncbi:tRNA (N6-threonylcarbamoyladenosine(37)-N6)-methyltransferase TrmO [uncultured Fibrobacter sp.]|uniref:tRNA (N6-threonylcarbamoyladenosine(37)-N6)-methyltransferase TrmO n=1 Tax=uncultured Fibrobacter sp. TaxID=261512 RepID=UPI0025D8E156|nr:tRNA (N6-threonylcarbamoyladenosine(37)-N6)-methyltransferase TrmO [uncultured Fibrobacter sp.]
MKDLNIKTIARIESDFPEKFGIPRQSGLLRTLKSVIRFEPEFRNADALRGLEGFSHLWILWIFSENVRDTWKPTVRPPRLGGNKRLGVFATRSSFRPNPIAMSCVKIEEIRTEGKNGPEIVVSGADLMDGTPIVDIKPYLPYTDSIADATSGFAIGEPERSLHVEITAEQLSAFPQAKREALVDLLAQDPRPHYQDDPERTYGFAFAGREIKFKVAGDTLTVIQVV